MTGNPPSDGRRAHARGATPSEKERHASPFLLPIAQKGKRCPAFIMNRQTPSNLAKRQGFAYAALRFLHQDAPLVSQTDRTRHGAYAATQQLLQARPEADGIIYSDDALAAVGMRALLDMNRRIPEDVAVIGVNNSFFAELCTPRLTSLDNMLYDQSLTAVRTLRTVLAGEHANRRVMICSEIIEREST